MKSNPPERISIKYMKPTIVKLNKQEVIQYIDDFIGYQIPDKALYLQAFQQTTKLKQDIRPQLKRIEKDLPEWKKGNLKIAWSFLSPRPPPKNKRTKTKGELHG